MLISITDANDPRVGDYRAIPEPELLRKRGLFVAEGRLVVRRLLASTRFRTRSVLVNAAGLASLRDVVLTPERDPLEVLVADEDTIGAIAGYNFHRGCLALGERPVPLTVTALGLDADGKRLVVVLEGLAQADNVGGVFRNAAAFGAAAILLDATCCDPLYRKAVRTSCATVFDVPYARMARAPDDLEKLRAGGYRLVALTPDAAARSIAELDAEMRTSRVALLVGGEGAGLSAELESIADLRVTIPMAVGIDSLNVATATGIALHRLS